MTPATRLRRGGAAVALAAALAAVLAAGLLTDRASAAPQLPPITPEQLVASVLAARPVALAGTVGVDNRLGLPAVPGLAADGLTDPTSTVRVWTDGAGRGRVAVSTGDGERTYVRDGTTAWAYDSADRTATRVPARDHADGHGAGRDPQESAREVVQRLRSSSELSVDGTTEVAGRPAYTLVLAPRAGERTVLRQVRVAVDAATRLPLELVVLGAGADPVLRVGFDELTVGPQDPALFGFTPPPGVTVRDGGQPHGPRGAGRPATAPRVVGDGWDAVVVATVPPRAPGAQGPDPSALGTPVSGPWGSGREITTNAGSAILTDDGRVAAGAVGTDVLGAALAR
ncbi:LolA family protein [Pseudonocardia spirodelae]|uniref:Outer membrane lipoprotein carrier protein LolA n=1 Tax=Pseudonocardia spirodelae TaxID=3133431 RepID=A0ABU8TCC3_9PSEU